MKLNHMFETPNYFKLFKCLGHRSGLGLGIFMSRTRDLEGLNS